GLRAARGVRIDSNYHGYWTMVSYPPGAQNNSHFLQGGLPWDGSWRLWITNSNGTTNLLDYNKNASNIVYWFSPASLANRLPIANSISGAVLTKTNNGLSISITSFTTWGDMRVTNQSSTFVAFRN
ncbi:MAG: hypothetical protein HY343_08290, partial [Lentisphaerae bacterium]|nr:hypothetical protein [Lentisphaerota bacterium]